MSALAHLALMVAGGAAALYADSKYARYEKSVTLGGRTIVFRPGTIAAAAGLAAIAFRAPVIGRGAAATYVAALAGGAAVTEGVKLAQEHVMPALGVSGTDFVGYDMRGYPGAYGQLPYGTAGISDQELAASLSQLRG